MGKGEVWLVNLSLGEGHEQSGQRPAILYSGPIAETVVVIPLTSNISRANLPFTELLKATSTNNLQADSVALIFQIRCISTTRLVRKVATLSQSEVRLIDAQVRGLFGL